MKRVLLVILVFLLIAGYGLAQDSLAISSLNNLEVGWDRLFDVKVENNVAAVVTGRSGIKLFDVSILESPVHRSTILGNYQTVGFFGSNYIVTRNQQSYQMELYDITQVDNPVFVSSFDYEYSEYNEPTRYEKYGNTLYVCYDNSYIQIFNLEDPSNPITYDFPGSFKDFAIINDHLVCITHQYMNVYDLVDPLNPSFLYSYDDGSNYYTVQVLSDSVIVSCSTHSFEMMNTNHVNDSLVVMSQVDNLDYDRGKLVGHYLFAGDNLYDNFNIFDLSDPSAPDSLYMEEFNFPYFKGIFENHAYGFDYENNYNNTVRQVDFYDMDNLLDFVPDDSLVGETQVGSLQLDENALYVVIDSTLKIYDPRQTSEMSLLGIYDDYKVLDFLVNGEKSHIITLLNWGYTHHIVDISNPLTITESDTSQYAIIQYYTGKTQGDNVFIQRNSYSSSHMWGWVDSSGILEEKRSLYYTSETKNVALNNDRYVISNAMVSTEPGGGTYWRPGNIYVYDLIAPEKFELTGFTDVMYYRNGLAIKDNYLYCFNLDNNQINLLVYDLNNENALFPEVTIEMDDLTEVHDAVIQGNHLFMSVNSADGNKDIMVLDISDELNPVEIGYIGRPSDFNSIHVQDDFIFASNNYEIQGFQHDLPLPSSSFKLLAPSDYLNESTATIDTLHFSWQTSEPAESENVSYDFHLRLNHPIDGDIYYQDYTTGTEIDVGILDLISTVDVAEPIFGVWWVNAVTPSHTRTCGSPFRFRILPLSDVDEPAAEADIPTDYAMHPAYPNPFNPSTTITVSLPETSQFSLKVFNHLGQEVQRLCEGQRSAGIHKFTFNAKGLAAGIYFAQALSENGWKETQKVVLLK